MRKALPQQKKIHKRRIKLRSTQCGCCVILVYLIVHFTAMAICWNSQLSKPNSQPSKKSINRTEIRNPTKHHCGVLISRNRCCFLYRLYFSHNFILDCQPRKPENLLPVFLFVYESALHSPCTEMIVNYSNVKTTNTPYIRPVCVLCALSPQKLYNARHHGMKNNFHNFDCG